MAIHRFDRLCDYLHKGDLLVVNDTRVFPARLVGRRVPTGGAVQCLLLKRREGDIWEALVKPGQHLRPGARIVFEGGSLRIDAEVLAYLGRGRRTLQLRDVSGGDVWAAVESLGHIPLPPYIRRVDEPMDRDRYQTVYARARGSVAAPTAGLHFTLPMLDDLKSRGIDMVRVTLHVGYGTFKPVTAERLDDHTIEPEDYDVDATAAAAITRAKQGGHRVIAVGTTTIRALESLTVDDRGAVAPASGSTGLFIKPGHRFQLVDGLVTNFHLPRSSLLVLVAAFAGRERILQAYREAVEHHYHFYSYGDAMLIL